MIEKDFYRKFGVLDFAKFRNPKFHEIGVFDFPKESLLHFIPDEDFEFGPSQNEWLFGHRDSAHVWHIENLAETQGRPKFKNTELRTKIKLFHKQNRKLRLLRKFEQGVRDEKNLVVVNYAMLQQVHVYPRQALQPWYEWNNTFATVMKYLKKYTDQTLRHQYIPVTIPDVFPEEDQLKLLHKKPTLDSIEAFKTNADFMFFELWKLSVCNDSAFLGFGDHAKYINFLFQRGGKFSVLNLGELLEWRTGFDLDDKVDITNNFHKSFLSFLTHVQQQATVTAEDDMIEEDDLDLTKNVYVESRTAATEERARRLMESGSMSVPEYKRAVRLAETCNRLKATNGQRSLAEQATVPYDERKFPTRSIPKLEGVFDEGMLESSLLEMDAHYTEHLMERDMAGMCLAAQNMGFAVTNFSKQRKVDAANKYDHYSVQLTGLGGVQNTVHFKVPAVDRNGKFKANGVTYFMAKQRGDLPIRKTKSTRVALTSYFGKTFVDRSSRSVYDQGAWARKKLGELGLDESSDVVKSVFFGKVECKDQKLPMLYTSIGNGVVGFECKAGKFNFDYRKREELYGELTLKKLERRGHVVCGHTNARERVFYTMDTTGIFHRQDLNGNVTTIGTLADLLETDLGRMPTAMTEVKVFGKAVPMGIILAYLVGLRKLLKTLKVKYRLVRRGQRAELAEDEQALIFADQTLVYKTDDLEANMILNGFYEYRNGIKQYDLHEFDDRQVYAPVLETRGLGLRHTREFELMEAMFIDPITYTILEKRNEPVTFVGLLLKANELLKDDRTPDETDTDYMRFKGYERFNGFVYKELVAAIRKQQASPMSAKSKVEINPKAVWMDILQDATVKPAEQLNPIINLKEKELVTYTGDGGRSARSMTAPSRVYHKNDMGVVSEATVDSGSVAINSYLSANPSFQDTMGLVEKVDPKKASSTQLLSTSAVLSPGATADDPKRTNFISIQHSHGVAGEGYQVMPVTTGYEQVLAHRTDEMFAYAAKEDGKVVELSDTHVTIEYKSKERVAVEIGTVYGIYNGSHVPQRIVTDVTKGMSFKAGHVLVWNSGYFDRNFHDRTQVMWKAGALITVALMESVDTLEDACAISEDLGRRIATEFTTVRNITVDFDQNISNLVKVGDDVDLETILCTLEDSLISENKQFSGDALDSLRTLGAINPKAKVKGSVERIEVLYNGETAEMSKTLKSITNKADKERAERTKRLANGDATTGQLSEPINIEGRRLTRNKAVIKVYITKTLGAGVGEKGVLGNQLKTIISRVMTGRNETESGEPLDMLFGRQSIANRIVLSPDRIGTLSSATLALSKAVAKEYFDNL